MKIIKPKQKSNHGGPRKGAGRKPTAKVVQLPNVEVRTTRVSQARMQEMLALSRLKPNSAHNAEMNVKTFAPYPPMPGVIPDDKILKSGKSKGFPIAMDEVIRVSDWGAANVFNGMFANGAMFLGYPFLSELLQIAEYRKIIGTLADHATRKFIKLQTTNSETDKTVQIKELSDAIENFKVREVFKHASEIDGGFGRAHIYLDTGDGPDREELLTPIGNGRNKMSQLKCKKGRHALKHLSVVEPMWTYPATYNASDPLSTDWYNPQTWFVQGKELHADRLLRMVSREVPDMLKPAYSFGGLAMSQMAMPYVDNWLRTRQSVADTVWSFSVNGMKTDMSAMMQPGAPQSIFERAELFNNLRNNRGLLMINEATEDYFQFNVPLGTLDMLQAQSQEQMASVSNIPLIFLLGISPHGMNASAEPEIRAFYDYVASYQTAFYKEPLTRIIDFIQLAIWGAVDPEITFSFEPLWSLDEKGSAEVRKIEAETDDLLINGGIVSPLEARKRVANDPETPYQGLDVNDLPTPPEQDLGGKSLDPGEPHDRPNDGSQPDVPSQGEA